jgi:hypothetical protein
MRIRTSYLFILLVVLGALVCAAGCTGGINPGTPATTSPPASTISGGSQKTPEQVVPDSIPGFEFQWKSGRQEGIFDGEDYFVVSFFKPEPGSMYEGKVDYLTIDADKFFNTSAASETFDVYGGNLTSVAGLSVKYRYDADSGVASYALISSTLLYESTVQAPQNVTSFDEQVLKNAAALGIEEAAKRM